MIARPTALILGAGASAPYGFPAGRTLLFQITSDLSPGTDSDLKRNLISRGFSEEKISELQRDLLHSSQPSVDAFLENRAEFADLGKTAIAIKLIGYENPQSLIRQPGKMQWYEYLFNQLGTRRDEFTECPLSVITFNYDRSLEYFLFTSLRSAYGLTNERAVALLKSLPIVHVYGQLGKLDIFDENGRPYGQEVTPENIDKAVVEIKIIHELDVQTDELTQAHKLIGEAEVVAFFGFGFHPANVKRLAIDNSFSGRALLGSAYHLGEDEKRRARQLFSKHDLQLGNGGADILEFVRNHPVFQ